MTKHTEGKWKYIFKDGKYQVEAPGAYICQMIQYGMVNQKEEYYLHEKANARLIAAAPELLEACKILLSYMESPDSFESLAKQGMLIAREAISKAEGNQ